VFDAKNKTKEKAAKAKSAPQPRAEPAPTPTGERLSFQIFTQLLAADAAAMGVMHPTLDGAGGSGAALAPTDSCPGLTPATTDGAAQADDPATVRAQLRNGRPLESGVRARMERGFGRSLSDVRLHTDGEAARLAGSLSARAFTVGNDIAFGAGQYRPDTLVGDLLIAHELAHTCQQAGAQEAQNGNSPELERDATRSAMQAVTSLHAEKPSLIRPASMPGPRLHSGLSLHRCECGGTAAREVSAAQCPTDFSTPGVGQLSLNRFLELTRDVAVNTAALAAEPATAAARLEGADGNNDGTISGEGEWRAIYTLLNRHLGGRPDDPLQIRRDEGGTAAGLILAALARISGSSRLRRAVGAVSLVNAVTLLGMSDTAFAEARALQREGTPVQLITDIPGRGDEVRAADGGRAFDLNRSDDRQGFVDSLPLPERGRQEVLRVLNQVVAGARREIAELARVWSLAYCNIAIPRRVVLSGHGDGTWISGDDHDFFNKNSVLNLGRALPQAARQIYSFHISSCQHGYDSRMEAFRQVFPDLQMIWGYAGSSPSGASAYRHMIVWERSTHGFPAGGRPLDPSQIAGTRRADVTAVWTRAGGWHGPQVRPFAELLRDATAGERQFRQYFDGQLEAEDPGRGFLYDYYNLLQQLSVHPEMDGQPDAVRSQWAQRRNQTLRLRLYRNVARNFQRERLSVVSAGYRVLGLAPPDFGTLSRRAALEQIRSFRAQMDRTASVPPEADRLWRELEALRELDEARIPMAWVE